MRNRHIWATSFYDRNIGVLQKSDYVLMRESVDKYLDLIRELDVDNYDEIDKLKLLLLRLDHHIARMR
ncbi:hypothetical protein E0H77_13550 [Acinetobacter sp. ANC 4633]|nr:hypothetical protein E0H77_13550 [Acinetobacter sp. ANC 4633]